jgi:hypothetical protein
VGRAEFADDVLLSLDAKRIDVIAAMQVVPAGYLAGIDIEERGNDSLQFAFDGHLPTITSRSTLFRISS